MSKVTVSLNNHNETDAAFRAWVDQFHAALTTAGLTQTADTGQINTATVVRAAANADAGFSIWRLNDTAQASAPMFFKFRFGTGGNGGNDPRLLFDVGEGSNGAGALTGATLVGRNVFGYNYSANNSQKLDVGINWNPTNGYFCMWTGNAYLAGPQSYTTFSAERLRTALGGPSTRGFAVVCGDGGSPYYWTFTPGSWAGDPGPSIPAFWPGQYTGAASAGGTFMSGLTPNTGDGTHGPLEKTLGFLVVGAGDFVGGESIPVTRWDGNLHQYVSTNTTGSASLTAGQNQGGYARHAVWWE